MTSDNVAVEFQDLNAANAAAERMDTNLFAFILLQDDHLGEPVTDSVRSGSISGPIFYECEAFNSAKDLFRAYGIENPNDMIVADFLNYEFGQVLKEYCDRICKDDPVYVRAMRNKFSRPVFTPQALERIYWATAKLNRQPYEYGKVKN